MKHKDFIAFCEKYNLVAFKHYNYGFVDSNNHSYMICGWQYDLGSYDTGGVYFYYKGIGLEMPIKSFIEECENEIKKKLEMYHKHERDIKKVKQQITHRIIKQMCR